jgi:hypothetical protein
MMDAGGAFRNTEGQEDLEVMHMRQIAIQQAEEMMQLAVMERDNPSTFLA